MADSTSPAKHLLFLSTVFPTPWQPHKGPATRNLVAAIRALGHRVSVIAPVPWTERLRTTRTAGVSGADYPTYWYTPGVLRHRYHDMLNWSLKNSLARLAASDDRPDAVLAFWAHPDGAAAVRFAKALRIPSGVIAAGSDVMLLPADPKRREVVRSTLATCDHLFAVGDEIARRAIAMGTDASRVSTFIQGVNLDRFAPGNRLEARRYLGLPLDGPLLLWVGNMVDVKAAHRVILAAREIARTVPGLSVAMVGSGPREAALKQLAAQSGELKSRIFFPGPIASERLPAWYHAADLMVFPSRSEGVPNVLLEAMATGLPFVATRVGSIADLLPFENSCTVEEGDQAALERAVLQSLNATSSGPVPPKRYDIREGAREIIHHLHLDRP